MKADLLIHLSLSLSLCYSSFSSTSLFFLRGCDQVRSCRVVRGRCTYTSGLGCTMNCYVHPTGPACTYTFWPLVRRHLCHVSKGFYEGGQVEEREVQDVRFLRKKARVSACMLILESGPDGKARDLLKRRERISPPSPRDAIQREPSLDVFDGGAPSYVYEEIRAWVLIPRSAYLYFYQFHIGVSTDTSPLPGLPSFC